jgi:hypothetical protein
MDCLKNKRRGMKDISEVQNRCHKRKMSIVVVLSDAGAVTGDEHLATETSKAAVDMGNVKVGRSRPDGTDPQSHPSANASAVNDANLVVEDSRAKHPMSRSSSAGHSSTVDTNEHYVCIIFCRSFKYC